MVKLMTRFEITSVLKIIFYDLIAVCEVVDATFYLLWRSHAAFQFFFSPSLLVHTEKASCSFNDSCCFMVVAKCWWRFSTCLYLATHVWNAFLTHCVFVLAWILRLCILRDCFLVTVCLQVYKLLWNGIAVKLKDFEINLWARFSTKISATCTRAGQ